MRFFAFFVDLSLAKGMLSRKLDFVKIVLTLAREHENQGLQGYKTCSKIANIDVKLYAKSCMRLRNDF